MRIAISTIQDFNIGNRLQNYALQSVLVGLGHSVESLRKRRLCLPSTIKCELWLHMKRIPVERFRGFDRQFISRSKYVVAVGYCSPGLAERYDKFVIGSDQVWNPHFGFNGSADYLPCVESPKKIAYAASFGVSSLGPAEEEAARLLRDIPFVSMREKAGADIVERLTERPVPVVLDPTMLLAPEDWTAVATRPKGFDGRPFVLKYILGDDVNARKVDAVAGALGAAVVDVSDPRLKIGPSEFVWLAARCEAVCTDSFHGSVFALLHHKPLCILERVDDVVDMSSRLDTLCDLFGVEHCRESLPGFDMHGADWEDFEARLARLRVFSLRWLESALAGEGLRA